MPADAAHPPSTPKETPKEAVIGLLISFIVVLIYRGFVFETFHIPTGSMAPTLRGAHMQFTSPQSGFTWAVNPWTDNAGVPTNPQGSATNPIRVSDPTTGVPIQPGEYPLRSGDRIAVLKYNWLHHPQRWDVIVFKMPENPSENYIKRLVGLPDEDLWMVDGDVFVRGHSGATDASSAEALDTGWKIARKPSYIQDAVWWPIHSSDLAPIKEDFDGVPWRSPWRGEGWTRDGEAWRADGLNPGSLEWDNELWPITDFAAYNQIGPWAPNRREAQPRTMVYPTSDLRIRAGVQPDAPHASVRLQIEARGHDFAATLSDNGVEFIIRPLAGGEVKTLLAKGFRGFPEGRITDVEFQNVDQALEVRVDGKTVGRMAYDWSPLERLRSATRMNDEQLDGVLRNGLDTTLSNPSIYIQPKVSIQASGAPVTLHRVGLDRDLFYQPAARWSGAGAATPALASHPAHLARLGDWEFMAAGDNSGNSRDSRLWDTVNPWVEAQTDVPVGLVPGDMLMGEAVVVFWPSPDSLKIGPIRLPFIPDVGRMRLIR